MITYELRTRRGTCRQVYDTEDRAREAKNGFGLMIDTARAAPVLIEKHGRGVVVVMSVEEYERLKEIEAGRMSASDDPARGSASGDGRQ